MKINILGAGNVATHLIKVFCNYGHSVSVWNRSYKSLKNIEEEFSCFCTDDISLLPKNADLYIISVKDDAVREVAGILSAAISNVDACVVHTSGTLPLKILTSYFKNAGVLYPLQTFTKNKQIDFSSVPFFIEGTAIVLNLLQKLLNDLSHNVYFIDSNERKLLHLASVFACNFVNHDIGIAKKILCKIDVPMSVIFPLISETIEKLKQLPPNEAQTGPAVREDFKVIDEHIKLLSDFPYEKAIYINTTNNIIRYKHLK